MKKHAAEIAANQRPAGNVFTYAYCAVPGVTRLGSRCDLPVSLVDIYPALFELAGLPAKDNLDGQNLLPLLKNPQQEWQRHGQIH